MAKYINDIETHIIRTNHLQNGVENLLLDTPAKVGISLMGELCMNHGSPNGSITITSETHEGHLYKNIVMSVNLDHETPTWCPIATVDDIPPTLTHIINYDYNIDIDVI